MTEPIILADLVPATIAEIATRAGRPDFDRWASQTEATGYCAHPIRLRGGTYRIHNDQVIVGYRSAGEPDGVTYLRCGNRRAAVCASCSHEYQGDMWHLLYAGVVNLLAMFVVTVLAGSLAERLRVAGGRLVAAEERADHAERLAALGRVATALAHEIRNPLGSISGCIQLLRVNRALSDEDQRLCAIIVSEASRLNDLVSDMMNLARPQRPQLSCVDAVATAREVVQLAAQSGRAVSDVRVSCSGAEQALICADSAQLRQLIWNLVRNAVQASRAGSEVRVSVNTRGGADQALAELLVQDDGVGLSDQARERIFDAFFTTRAQGTGVGLAVVKRIADDHRFTIDVESQSGHGATFRVQLGPLIGLPVGTPIVREERRTLFPSRA